MKRLTMVFLAFFLVSCTANTIVHDLTPHQKHFIQQYSSQKFYDYGCNPPEFEAWTIMNQKNGWEVSFIDTLTSTRQTIRFAWDGESEYAETTFIQIDNQIRFSR